MQLLDSMLAKNAGWATEDERFEDVETVLDYVVDIVEGVGLEGGNLLVADPDNGIGFATGAGGAVTQETTISTTVEIDTPTGQITTVASTLGAGLEATFTVTNAAVAATDVVVVSPVYTGAGTLLVLVGTVAAGSFTITLSNLHASAALDDVVVINYVVLKGVAA